MESMKIESRCAFDYCPENKIESIGNWKSLRMLKTAEAQEQFSFTKREIWWIPLRSLSSRVDKPEGLL
jgi:hypothetical protein